MITETGLLGLDEVDSPPHAVNIPTATRVSANRSARDCDMSTPIWRRSCVVEAPPDRHRAGSFLLRGLSRAQLPFPWRASVLKPGTCERRATLPHNIAVDIEYFCMSRTRVFGAAFTYGDVVLYDGPSDVVPIRVEPEHLEGQLILVLANVLPNSHVGGERSGTRSRNHLCGSAEFILMETRKAEQLGAGAAIQNCHLHIPNSDNAVVASSRALRPCG